MGQIQTETPYFQPSDGLRHPFPPVNSLKDPTCHHSGSCEALGLRVVDSRHVNVYGAGLYSFFDNYNSCTYSTRLLSPPTNNNNKKKTMTSKLIPNPSTDTNSMFLPRLPQTMPAQPIQHRRRRHQRRQYLQSQHRGRGEHDIKGWRQSGELQR